MRTVIIEDNQSSQNLLKGLIAKYAGNLEVLGESTHVKEGVELIEKINPDLVFLDVEMPDGTGFDLLSQLPQINFKVIFTTAHQKYALQAIKCSALDYLLKPIDPENFIMAIEKASEEAERELSEIKVKNLLKNLHQDNQKSHTILLKDKYGLQVVKVDEIIRLEAMGSYTHFFIEDHSPILTSKVLKEYVELLPSSKFFRCHQSHLVNLDYLQRYDKREGDVLMLRGGSQVPLAVRKREVLLERIQNR